MPRRQTSGSVCENVLNWVDKIEKANLNVDKIIVQAVVIWRIGMGAGAGIHFCASWDLKQKPVA